MSYRPTMAYKLNVAGVTFSQDKKNPSKIYMNDGDHSIFFQTSELDVRYDTGEFKPFSNSTDSGKYTVRSVISGHNNDNSKKKLFFDKMVELDEAVLNAAQENSVAWFKKKNMSRDMVESIYTPIVKMEVDRDTGEVDESRAPKFTFKIPQYDGEVKCRFFDEDKPPDDSGERPEMNVNDNTKDDYKKVGIVIPWEERMTIPHEGLFKKNAKVTAILRCKGVWIFGGKFGCTWDAEQIGLKEAPSFANYAFLDSDDDTETGDKTAQGDFVDSSSDDEEVENDGHVLTRTDTKKA